MEFGRSVIILLGFMLAACAGLPASIKDDVEPVTTKNVYGDKPIVDTGVFSGWENPFGSNPFGGLFDNLEGIMDRMRQQIASLLSRFPAVSGGNSTEDISPYPSGLESAVFPGIGGIDLSKGNSTSITKVIDGHTVVINETEYKNEDDFGGTFFKVRIIDVKPDPSETSTEKDSESATSKDREEVANSMENEIFKSKEAEAVEDMATLNSIPGENMDNSSDDQFANLETFDEAPSFDNNDNSSTYNNESRSSLTTDNREDLKNDTDIPEWSLVDGVDTVDSNAIDFKEGNGGYQKKAPFDLSRDTYVNEILAREGAPENPDAEVFMVENIQNPRPSSRFIDPR